MNQKQKAIEIVKKIQENSYTAYFCGGCVRDQLIGKEPKDYDIVTNATPDDIKKIFPRTLEVGIKFGIICIKYKGDFFEVATFRKDGEYHDGRRPDKVDFTDDKEDAKRRDFTVNGIFYDPISNKVIDYVGGGKDIQNKIIRTIGSPEQRFNEDYLRLMRAIRFATQLDFAIEDETWKCVQEKAHYVSNVSKERKRDELLKMLRSPNAERAFTLLIESKIWFVLFPQIENNPLKIEKTKKIIKVASPIDSDELAIAILFFYFLNEQIDISEISKSLVLSNATEKFIVHVSINYSLFQHVKQFDIARLKKFLRQEHFNELLQLHYLDCIVCQKSLENYSYCQEKLQELKNTLFASKVFTGNDLKKLGISPGPIYKSILEDIENKQLSGQLEKYSDIADYVKQFYIAKDIDITRTI